MTLHILKIRKNKKQINYMLPNQFMLWNKTEHLIQVKYGSESIITYIILLSICNNVHNNQNII